MGYFNVYRLPSLAKGFTLVELAITMLLLSVALAPVIALTAGKLENEQALSTIGGEIRSQNKGDAIANSLMQRALLGSLPTGSSLESTLDLTTLLNRGDYFRTGKFNYPGDGGRYQYDWEVHDASYPYLVNQGTHVWGAIPDATIPSEMALGNRLVLAKVNVYDSRTNVLVSKLSSMINVNTPADISPLPEFKGIAIDILVDTSLSMTDTIQESTAMYRSRLDLTGIADLDDHTAMGSPFYHDRYFQDSTSPAHLNYLNDSQLDIAGFFTQDNPPQNQTSKYPDNYGASGVLGMPNECNPAHADYDMNSAALNNFFVPLWRTGGVAANVPGGFSTTIANRRAKIIEYTCAKSNATPLRTMSDYLNKDLSRLELARATLLSLMLRLEERPEIYDNVKIGLSLFNAKVEDTVPIQETVSLTNPVTGNPKEYYNALRQELLWLNRYDALSPGGKFRGNLTHPGTNLYLAISTSRNKLNATQFDGYKKIIVLITDGEATVGTTGVTPLRTLIKNLGQDDQIALHIVDMSGGYRPELKVWSELTPGGLYASATPTGMTLMGDALSTQVAFSMYEPELMRSLLRYGLDITRRLSPITVP
ncbi:MAG: prepilin-type N-terminal cleavage/methylation domain-containing protein [Vampirovibrionales bacterium]|nr:prepilin-type N-terminal cleavage/methylation domain-containing protein [Vampirovibrionales bacterium]